MLKGDVTPAKQFPFPHLPQPLVTTNLLSVSLWTSLYWLFPVKGIALHVALPIWPLSRVAWGVEPVSTQHPFSGGARLPCYPLLKRGYWVVSSFQLLGITLLWKFMPRCLLKLRFSFLWGMYIGMEWLSPMAAPCLIYRGLVQLPTVAASCAPTRGVRRPRHPHPPRLAFQCLLLAVIVGVMWRLTVVLIFISLLTSDVEHLSCTFWSFVYHLQRNPYLTTSPAF